jgi:hypothetical protein
MLDSEVSEGWSNNRLETGIFTNFHLDQHRMVLLALGEGVLLSANSSWKHSHRHSLKL